MLSLRKPATDFVQEFIRRQAPLQFTYPAVGATTGTPPAGYVVDRVRVKLGAGEATYLAAREALARWEQFQLGWIAVVAPLPLIEQRAVVAIAVRTMGAWWLNASRIIYVIDEAGPTARFGFAYGTLPGHAESGEVRFLVDWDRAEGAVWYSILAFSRPRHWLTRLGYPMVRRLRRRFGRESAAAMLRAVARAQDGVMRRGEGPSL
jgi:uncharacterized protein (UPF0548 family)